MQLAGTDLRLLMVFDAVVRHGGFGAAQVELNVGISTISNHISALETRLGVRLCKRGRGGFKLTEEGAVVHLETRKLLQTVDAFSLNVSLLKGHLVGTLRLGIVDAIASDPANLLHDAIRDFMALPNDVRFEMRQNAPQELQDQVGNGALDLAIGSFPHKVAGLAFQPLYQEAHSLYCGAAHRLFAVPAGDLRLADLQAEAVVGRGYWRDSHHSELGFSNIRAVVYEIEPQLILIRSGAFIGYLPDHFAKPWVAAKALRCLSPVAPGFSVGFDLVTRKGVGPSHAAQRLAAAIVGAFHRGV